ncbi:DUF262 domain-containing protein [Streptacidiphilus sp. N1-12]|uniref:DUF262 domain-containing protein n=2 Tax=Streptacidiphilus alkalitolerans TaxID=3342712 RepID=A0ABV6WDS5_9ACTN
MNTQPDWDDVDGEENSNPEEVRSVDITRTVVTDTDWTAETILSQLRRGNIQLNPRFQRRDAWDKTRKSRFIESLILGLPIPQIVLAEDRNRRGKFIVLDGKQRLLTLQQFAVGSSISSADSDSETLQGFGLTGLEVRSDLRLVTLKRLEDSPELVDDLNAFLNQTIRTVVVRSWPNEEFLNLVFLRLNTGSVRLSPQELRQALHPGPFTDYLDDKASASTSLQKALRLDKPDFRMRDVEVLLRYFAFEFFLEDYSGNLKRFLDNTVNSLNDSWVECREKIEGLARSCEIAIETTFEVFGDQAFYRWSYGGYEGRFNRAVFDIMTFYFSKKDVREKVSGREEFVRAAFERICAGNRQFVESIQTTTKTTEATQRRLSIWGQALGEAIEMDLSVPALVENRLVLPSE